MAYAYTLFLSLFVKKEVIYLECLMCKWCKEQFDADSRTRQDKFGNWMHIHCWADMREVYFRKAEVSRIKNENWLPYSPSKDIYGGTG